MPLPLPNLDTRAFPDLVDEARAAIPRYSPSWTDHNLSDPGITLTELVAAEVDRQVWAVHRLSDRDRRTLLRLLGFPPAPPRPARAILSFALRGAGAPIDVPAGLVVGALDRSGADVPFVTSAGLRIGRARLVAAQAGDDGALRDTTKALLTGERFSVLGSDPSSARSSSFLLGFAPAPDPGRELTLHVELEAHDDLDAVEADHGVAARTTHHDAAVVWEWLEATGWAPASVVLDQTRALTRSGAVRIAVAGSPPLVAHGAVASPAAWLRCRLASGRPDRAPVVSYVAAHAVAAIQSVPAFTSFDVAPGCQVTPGAVPVAGTSQPVAFAVDADGHITDLAAGPSVDGPEIEVLQYTPPGQAAPRLVAAAVVVGRGERVPLQALELPGAPVTSESVRVWVTRGTTGERVTLVPGRDAAGAHDLVAVLEASTGRLVFGDGRHGRMLVPGELVLASYERTIGERGNLRAHATCKVAGVDDLVDGARLATLTPGLFDSRADTSLPISARGGEAAETVVRAAGRAARSLHAHERLLELLPSGGHVTLDGLDPTTLADRDAPARALNVLDLERIVLSASGCEVARARAWPEIDPALPGMRVAGTVSVVVLPWLPAGRPEPTPGLLAAVRRVVESRRVVGSRIVVTGPTYVDVTVRSRLRARPGFAPADVAANARRELDRFLHPLRGGRAARGWPFGRDVFRADVLGVLDAAAGVDAVVDLELVGPAGPTCGNVCLPHVALVAAGNHVLEVEA